MPTVRPDFMPVPQLLPCVEEWTGRSRLYHYGRYSAIAFVLSLYGRGGDGGRIAPPLPPFCRREARPCRYSGAGCHYDKSGRALRPARPVMLS